MLRELKIEVAPKGLKTLEDQLIRLTSDSKVNSTITRATKRAATHGKTVGTKLVRKTYTIKPRYLKKGIYITTKPGVTYIHIIGKRESMSHYKVKARKTPRFWKRNIFVSVKRGREKLISRAYAYNGTFWRRKARENYWGAWGKKMYGPAVPQLFGNPAIKQEIADAAMKKYEERLRHEVGRVIGV